MTDACCIHCLKMFSLNVLNPGDGFTASGECPHCGKVNNVEVRIPNAKSAATDEGGGA